MRTRPLALALLLAFAPVAVPATSWAQQVSTEDSTTEMARARFKEGVGFFDRGQFEQARAAFLQAYALKKHPTVLLNLAWSSLKSGHPLEAQHSFKLFLTESKDITDKQRADASDGLNQANAALGRVDIVAGMGTEITVDGDKAGTMPLPDPVMVEPGAHTVKFKGADGTTDTESVTVLAGERAIARFAKPAPVASMVAPSPAPTTDAASAAPLPPASTATAAKHEPMKESPTTDSHKGIFAPPANLVPVVIGSVLVVASVGLAIGMIVAKQSAQNRANETGSQIRGVGGTSCNPPGPPNVAQLISSACANFVGDNNNVNTDATVGNLAVGAGVVAAGATLVYWLLADKGGSPTPSSATRPIITPLVDRATGGLSFSGAF